MAGDLPHRLAAGRPYTPSLGMVRELARIAQAQPAGDWLERQRCVSRGLVMAGRLDLTEAGRAVLARALTQFKLQEARHGR